MNKKQVKKTIASTKNRTRNITIFVFLIVFFAFTSAFFIIFGINKQVNYYVHYNEYSNLDYKVYLKENDYFGKFLGKDKQYIASLIDYITANFKYKLSVDEDIDYKYYYYIEAETLVLDYNDKVLYQKNDIVLPKKEYNDTENYSFEINEDVKLDYNYYNDIVNTFVSRYDLNNTKSYINLKMYVGINGDCKEYSASLKDAAVISMNIPLSRNTVNVNINYKLNSGTDKLMECKKNSIFDNKELIIGIGFTVLDIILVVLLIIYAINTRSIQTVYNKILKKIFNNYGRYISKIKTEIGYRKFQIVLVEEFEDLFEIRNSSNSPILFSQNPNKTKSAFVVPTNSGLVYIYYLSIKNIEKEVGKNEKKK